jgi:hypothetical protein
MTHLKRYASLAVLLCASLVPALAFSADASPAHALLMQDSAPGWRGWETEGFPPGWQVKDGVLSKNGPVDDLISTAMYGNFELTFEWKIGKAGNSGVFYRGTREYDHIYWSAPEYQLLDDANAPDGKHPITSAASGYALYAPAARVSRPFGHWNRSRIVVNGNHVEHWLNGHKVVVYELLSPDWTAKVAASKYAPYPNYGRATTGFIGIQGDHPGSLAIRDLRIRELP